MFYMEKTYSEQSRGGCSFIDWVVYAVNSYAPNQIVHNLFWEIDHEIISKAILIPSAELRRVVVTQLQAKVFALSTGFKTAKSSLCKKKSVVS